MCTWNKNPALKRYLLCACVHCSVVSDSLWPHGLSHQAPLSMEYSRQEYWTGWPFPTPGDPSDPGIKPASPALTGGFFTTEPPKRHWKVLVCQSSPTLWRHGLKPARLLCPWDCTGSRTGVGCHSLLGDLPHPGIKPASLALPADSLLSEGNRLPSQ